MCTRENKIKQSVDVAGDVFINLKLTETRSEKKNHIAFANNYLFLFLLALKKRGILYVVQLGLTG